MTELPPGPISVRLRAARERAGFKTARDAAAALGVSPPSYYAHENGSRRVSVETAVAYARALGVNLEWLLTGDASPPDAAADAEATPAASDEGGAGAEGSTAPASPAPGKPKAGRSTGRRTRPFGFHSNGGKPLPVPEPPSAPPETAPRWLAAEVTIVAEARRGAFVEPDLRRSDFGVAEIECLPGVDPRDLFGVRVGDASLDELYPEGSTVICRRVPKGTTLQCPPKGILVAIETTFAGLVEYTIAELRDAGSGFKLRFRSTDWLLRGEADFEPERPILGRALDPFHERRRTIAGVVFSGCRVR